VLVELTEVVNIAWYDQRNENRVSVSYVLKMVRLQESANRRYLAAIRELARVRKLQNGVRAAYSVAPRGGVLAGAFVTSKLNQQAKL
jgi:hypothetical protein